MESCVSHPRLSVSALRRWRGRGYHLGLLKTRPAQYRPIPRGLEGDYRWLSTFRADDLGLLEFLGGRGESFGFTSLATLGVVCELLVEEEELLSSRENELGFTVNAVQSPISKFHSSSLSPTDFRLKQSPGCCSPTAPPRGRTNCHPPALNPAKYIPRCSIRLVTPSFSSYALAVNSTLVL